eukprot:5731167-Pyramimonas_sp.AAC.1
MHGVLRWAFMLASPDSDGAGARPTCGGDGAHRSEVASAVCIVRPGPLQPLPPGRCQSSATSVAKNII